VVALRPLSLSGKLDDDDDDDDDDLLDVRCYIRLVLVLNVGDDDDVV
jgi:hypothetical protein